ncbi:hypothetical protein, partial [Pseudomonas syringae]|uniref:hypothetical protein n=1 Tax=Pseudomonas syringae TaxID=317 RepID=UPI003AF35F5F
MPEYLDCLLTAEGLGFLINSLTVSIDPYLCAVSSSVALAWSDRAHLNGGISDLGYYIYQLFSETEQK